MRSSLPLVAALSAATASLVGCDGPTLSPVNYSPEVTIDYPSPGATVLEGVELVATGIVEDADPQDTHRVWWTDENGDTVCDEDGVEPPANVSCAWTPWGGNQLICLHADDGRAEDSHSEVCVTVVATPTDPPSATIIHPESGGVYYSDKLITFEGEVADAMDDPADLGISWSSSLSGDLDFDFTVENDGGVLGFGYLDEGEQAVTLRVENTGGNVETDSVTIEVGPPNTAPTCEILSPEDGEAFRSESTVEFEAEVADVDVPADWLTVSWTSSLDGELGESIPTTDGQVSFAASDLSIGTHTITMEVVDEVDGRCTTNVGLTVGSAPTLTIVEPADGSSSDEDELIVFHAEVSDNEDVPEDLVVTWTSSIDKEFASGSPDSSGSSMLTAQLSPGDHSVTATVTDLDGLTDSVTITLEIAACTDAWYTDGDGDGFGDPATEVIACDQPTATVPDGGDCDDADAAVNPDADELCDGIDNDCDGSIDDATSVDASTWYADADGDGYGDASSSQAACSQPKGYVSDNADCDDGDSAVSPAGSEVCDGVDNDCDGTVDEDDATDAPTWYADSDGDGYGDASGTDVACSAPTGYVADNTDCDDAAGSTYPGAPEYCDGVDSDCDGTLDEDDATDAQTWYADSDSDGYGDPLTTDVACYQPSGYVGDDSDCDDTVDRVHPGADEYCNGVDDDCDGTVDEADALDVTTWYADSDGDGYGDDGSTLAQCNQPSGYESLGGDCDDTDASRSPGEAEVVGDGIDSDCEGGESCYADADGDGYRTDDLVSSADMDCSDSGEALASVTSGDCDDTDASIYPGAPGVIADGIDQDCDGLETCYADADGDSYRTDVLVASLDPDCSDSGEALASMTSGDCDDSDASVHPGATETYGDEIDSNCNGLEGCYVDADNDGYRTSSTVSSSDTDCSDPGEATLSDPSGDCDDGNSAINPGASETTGDGVDYDCDGTEICYRDYDDDGYRPDSTSTYTSLLDTDCGDSHEATASMPTGDCDDSDATSYPGASEIRQDGADNDCDGTVDECGHSVASCSAYNAEQVSCCIDALSSSGGTVYLDWTGTSYFDETVELVDNVSLEGLGKTSTIMAFSGDQADDLISGLDVDNVALMDFALEGTRTTSDCTCSTSGDTCDTSSGRSGTSCDGETQACIILNKSSSSGISDILLENMSVKYCWQYGLHIKYATNVEIINLTAGYNGYYRAQDGNVSLYKTDDVLITDGGVRYSAGHGINLRGCQDVVVHDITVGYNHHSGVRASGESDTSAGEDSRYILLDNTDILDSDENGVEFTIESGQDVHDACVMNSYIEGNGTGVHFHYVSGYDRSSNTYSSNGTKESITYSTHDGTVCGSLPRSSFPFSY
jgi:hypothetical protein